MDMLREVRGGVLRLTINRPAKVNTLTTRARDVFVAALRDAQDDDAVGAVLLDAAACKVFSGGVDLSNPDRLPAPLLAERRASIVFDMTSAALDFGKPFVAAVGAPAIGGGCLAALMADHIVCGPHAAFSLPEIRLGIPSFLAATLVAHRVGPAVARQMVLAGKAVGGKELSCSGAALVAREGESLEAAVQRQLGLLCAIPRSAYRELKEWMHAPLRERVAEAIELTKRRNALDASHAESAAAISRIIRPG